MYIDQGNGNIKKCRYTYYIQYILSFNTNVLIAVFPKKYILIYPVLIFNASGFDLNYM